MDLVSELVLRKRVPGDPTVALLQSTILQRFVVKFAAFSSESRQLPKASIRLQAHCWSLCLGGCGPVRLVMLATSCTYVEGGRRMAVCSRLFIFTVAITTSASLGICSIGSKISLAEQAEDKGFAEVQQWTPTTIRVF